MHSRRLHVVFIGGFGTAQAVPTVTSYDSDTSTTTRPTFRASNSTPHRSTSFPASSKALPLIPILTTKHLAAPSTLVRVPSTSTKTLSYTPSATPIYAANLAGAAPTRIASFLNWLLGQQIRHRRRRQGQYLGYHPVRFPASNLLAARTTETPTGSAIVTVIPSSPSPNSELPPFPSVPRLSCAQGGVGSTFAYDSRVRHDRQCPRGVRPIAGLIGKHDHKYLPESRSGRYQDRLSRKCRSWWDPRRSVFGLPIDRVEHLHAHSEHGKGSIGHHDLHLGRNVTGSDGNDHDFQPVREPNDYVARLLLPRILRQKCSNHWALQILLPEPYFGTDNVSPGGTGVTLNQGAFATT